MKTFYTSDHHFGHYNIIKYCNRPWNSTYEMDYELIRLWNETVAPEDEVFYLGDFAMNKLLVPKIMAQLNGTKYLIPGNHDKCWGGTEKWVQFYKDGGFATINRVHETLIDNHAVVLTHLPYRNLEDPDQRYMNERLIDDGRILLHGHVHDRWKVNKKMINVGVDVWDYKPVSHEEIVETIRMLR